MHSKALKTNEIPKGNTGSNSSNLTTACTSIVSRLEVLPDRSAKVSFRVIYAGVGLSLVLLLVEVTFKHLGTFGDEQDMMRIVIMNVMIAAVCFVAMVCSALHYIYR